MSGKSVDEQKRVIREAMRKRRAEVPAEERDMAAIAVAANADKGTLDLFQRAQTLMMYLSGGHELPMRFLMDRAWRRGKKICVPAYEDWCDSYRPVEFLPNTQMIKGKFNIREPAVQVPVQIWDINAIIVPGLAFDITGGRLGYGGGYFDKILAKAPLSTISVGVAYDWQVLPEGESLPQHIADKKLSWIVTDKRVIDCRTKKVVYQALNLP
jgi:5-formyltetrahydrofolate cyclo-ligase